MATPESTPSRRLINAARAERSRLHRSLDRLDERARRLRDELAEVERAASEVRARLSVLAQVAHDDELDSALTRAHLRAVSESPTQEHRATRGYLKGAEIRIEAVRILASQPNPTRPINYNEWYELVTAAGYGVSGADPKASFLTQVGRSPLVQRTSDRGIYVLDLEVPRRLRHRLHQLHAELAALHEGQQTIDEIATVGARRAELTSEVVRVERALEEALASLGMEPEDPTT